MQLIELAQARLIECLTRRNRTKRLYLFVLGQSGLSLLDLTLPHQKLVICEPQIGCSFALCKGLVKYPLHCSIAIKVKSAIYFE